MRTETISISTTFRDREVIAEGTYIPGWPGQRYGPAPTPPEPETVEDLVLYHPGPERKMWDVELTDEEYEQLESKMIEQRYRRVER